MYSEALNKDTADHLTEGDDNGTAIGEGLGQGVSVRALEDQLSTILSSRRDAHRLVCLLRDVSEVDREHEVSESVDKCGGTFNQRNAVTKSTVNQLILHQILSL